MLVVLTIAFSVGQQQRTLQGEYPRRPQSRRQQLGHRAGEKDSDWLHISRNRFRRGFLKQQSIISESRASK
jgi:hypothetical protein